MSDDEFRRQFAVPDKPKVHRNGSASLNGMFAEPPPEQFPDPTKEIEAEFSSEGYGEEVHMPPEPPKTKPRKTQKGDAAPDGAGRPMGKRSGQYKFSTRPRLRKGLKEMTPRKRAQTFFEDNLMDFAVTMWEVSTDQTAKPSERYGAAKAAIEFARGKAGQEEQIRNEKPELMLHKIGGGELKEALLGKSKVEGGLPDAVRDQLRETERQLQDDVIPQDEDIEEDEDE